MAKPGRWADLRIRVLSALVLVPVALACVWVGGLAFWVLIGLVVAGLLAELLSVSTSPVVVGGAARPCASLRQTVPAGTGTAGRPRWCTGLLAGGLLYIAIPAASLLWLRADRLVGRADMLVLLALVWASDVGAYAVGRAVGGPKLAPSISPGKTISGACGGLLAAIAVGLGAALTLSHPPHLLRAGLLAGGLGIVAQAGDLFESWVKRRLGVKDSGTLIPGHGGLFDRVDALLAAAPAAALLALWAGRGLAWWE